MNVRNLLVTALLALVSLPLSAQRWEALTSLYGISTFAVQHVAGDVWLCGAQYGGMYRSTNNGANWSFVMGAGQTVRSLFLLPNGHVLAGMQQGMLLSTDQGVTWAPTNFPSDKNAFSIARTSGGSLLVAGWSGLWRSDDQGSTWNTIGDGLPTERLQCVALESDGDILVGTYVRGMHRSSDGGSTWQLASTDATDKTVSWITVDGNRILAAVVGVGVLLSTDAGAAWTAKANGLVNLDIDVLAITPSGALLAGDRKGLLYRSVNAGDSWQTVYSSDGAAKTFAMGNGKIFAGVQPNSLLLSSDDGASWSQSRNGLTNVMALNMFKTTTGTMLAATDNRGLLVSRDAGNSWQELTYPVQYENPRMLGEGANKVLWLVSKYGIARSSDECASFVVDTFSNSFRPIQCMHIGTDGKVYLGRSSGVIAVTADNGATWTSLNPLPVTAALRRIQSDAGTLYASALGPGLFKSVDQGQSWTNLLTTIDNLTPYNFAFHRQFGLVVNTDRGMFHSTNDGANWTNISYNYLGTVNDLAFTDDGAILAASGSQGVHILTPTADAWRLIDEGLHSTNIVALQRSPDGSLWACSYANSFFRYIPAANPVQPLPDESAVRLGVLYPNPGVDACTLEFTEQGRGCRIALCDVLGRELRSWQAPPDAVRQSLSLEGLPVGNYIIRLVARGAAQSIMVVKRH